MRIPIRDINGRWKRICLPWTPEIWNNGYIWKKQRFRVYRPDYPRANCQGYTFRSHIVFWLQTGIVPKQNELLHHKNGNKLDDAFENLELMPFGRHTILHCARPPKCAICANCRKAFFISKNHGHRIVKFCSQRCYHALPRTPHHIHAISIGLKRAYTEGRR